MADGDRLLLEVVEGDSAIGVLLLHGLSGSADSQYIIGLQNLFHRHGIYSIAMNHRGAKSPNDRARGYHSGASDDVAEAVGYVSQHYAKRCWYAIGFSLGGNVLLKYLAEHPQNPLCGAFAVSVPLRLDICATQLDTGFSRVYRQHLLSELRHYQMRKYAHLAEHFPDEAKKLATVPYDKAFNSFWDYDHDIIAPLHGYASAEDYYARASSGPMLHNVATPTRILHALDDPFMTEAVLPAADTLSPQVDMEITRFGGHVGFYAGDGKYYVEQRVAQWLGLPAQDTTSSP